MQTILLISRSPLSHCCSDMAVLVDWVWRTSSLSLCHCPVCQVLMVFSSQCESFCWSVGHHCPIVALTWPSWLTGNQFSSYHCPVVRANQFRLCSDIFRWGQLFSFGGRGGIAVCCSVFYCSNCLVLHALFCTTLHCLALLGIAWFLCPSGAGGSAGDGSEGPQCGVQVQPLDM